MNNDHSSFIGAMWVLVWANLFSNAHFRKDTHVELLKLIFFCPCPSMMVVPQASAI